MGGPTAIRHSPDNENSQSLPYSYTALPRGPSPAGDVAEPRKALKGIFVIFCGLLVLVSWVAFVGYSHRTSDAIVQENGNVPSSTIPETVPSSKTWKPTSRGVSAGVSEKSSGLRLGGVLRSYPWNNSMLSWQRTAYHFQPEKNWMNGNSLFP